MKRFTLALAASTALAAVAFTATVAAQEKRVRINMTSVFPGNLVLAGEHAVHFTKKVQRASGGSIDLRFSEPGALVPALQGFDAVSAGSVDAGWAPAGFWSGKDTAFNMFASVPFGPGVGEYMAWMEYGGGNQLATELYAKYNVIGMRCGLIAPEASGWFRREIKSLADLKGIKMRFFGLGARVMEKLGVSTQLIAPGEIYQALQLGTIDATEFSMPAMDLKLGFHQVAKFYYFPGWHQQSTFIDFYIGKKKWDELSDTQKAIIQLGCGDTMAATIADGEAAQFKALQEMQAKGVQIKRWTPEILGAMEKAWNEVVAEESAKNPNFKRAYDSYAAFRKNYAIWKDLGYLK